MNSSETKSRLPHRAAGFAVPFAAAVLLGLFPYLFESGFLKTAVSVLGICLTLFCFFTSGLSRGKEDALKNLRRPSEPRNYSIPGTAAACAAVLVLPALLFAYLKCTSPSAEGTLGAYELVRALLRLPCLLIIGMMPDSASAAVADLAIPAVYLCLAAVFLAGYCAGPVSARRLKEKEEHAKQAALRKLHRDRTDTKGAPNRKQGY